MNMTTAYVEQEIESFISNDVIAKEENFLRNGACQRTIFIL